MSSGIRASMLAIAVAVIAVMVVAAAPARAQGLPALDPVRLVYDRRAGGRTCPEESFFRNVVASHLGGRDPFTPDAARRITLTIRRGRSGFVALAVYFDGDGKESGYREHDEPNCTSLIDSMGTIVGISLRPLPPKPPEPPPQKPEAPNPPPPPKPPDNPPPKPPVPRRSVVVELGPHASVGALPGPAFGLTGAVGVRWPMFSLALEVRADLPRSTDPRPDGGSVRETLILGSVAPCLHAGWLVGCGLVSGGALVGEGIGGPGLLEAVSPYVGAGARLGVEVPIAPPRLSLRAAVDVLAPFVRRSARLSVGDGAWIPPPAGGTAGVRLVASF